VDVDNTGSKDQAVLRRGAARNARFRGPSRDALGREYPNFTLPIEAPVDGQTVRLTIDLGLQEIVEDALDSAMERTRARKGASSWSIPAGSCWRWRTARGWRRRLPTGRGTTRW
jgi:hypothetical protein